MRWIKDVLRLRAAGLSRRQVAQSCGIARSTVAEYLKRAEAAGLSWPELSDLDDAELEKRLFPPPISLPAEQRAVPDWASVHRELKRKGVTLQLLWDEYKAANPEGYQYSWFCEHYRDWLGKVDVVMRQDHRAGEKLFVDYAGQTIPIIDRDTGEVVDAQIYVAVLGGSNYTFAEGTLTQTLPDWIGSHVHAFTYFGAVPAVVVPDNLKSGVHRAHRYEPEINATYAEMARHYGVAIVPTRSARPRDKAKVEAGVLVVERWILARLRNRTFFSLAELNAAIAELLEELNERPFKKLPGTRRSLFETLDRPAMRPLPARAYEYAEWKKVRVNIDYHVAIDKHYYSVPYQLVKQELEARVTANTVELLHKGKRVASHRRSRRRGGHTTVTAHMPKAHRDYAEWTPERLVRWAQETGLATAKLVETILTARPHPQHGFRACLGIMRLGKRYGAKRLEAASRRALAIGACSYKSVESILKNGLDKKPLPATTIESPAIEHDNLRGPDYYH
ncbi:MAG: IS21 family transposase [Woeseiaceae bacterium]